MKGFGLDVELPKVVPDGQRTCVVLPRLVLKVVLMWAVQTRVVRGAVDIVVVS